MITAFRKLLLLVFSIVAIALAVLLYGWVVGPEDKTSLLSDGNTPNRAADLADIKRIGPRGTSLERGERLEYYRRGAGGHIERVYRAEHFQLQADDRALLREVTFVWYLKNGQSLTLTSETGEVHLDQGAERMQPTSGLLRGNVQIVFRLPIASMARQNLAGHPAEELVISTDELEFDTRSCRLWTDRAVQLRGKDLDVDGTGFLLQWREISREVDRLVIEHGGELTWRGGEGHAFSELFKEREAKVESTPEETLAAKPNVEPERIHTYWATFEKNVRVTYQDQVVNNMDRLTILFDMILSGQSSQTTTSSPAENKAQPANQLDDMHSSPPLRLTWNDKLTIVPADPQVQQSATGQRFRLEASGLPVTFRSRDMSGSCAKLEAEQDSGIINLSGSSEFGVFLESPDGTSIITEQLLIDPPIADGRLIRLLGKGSLKTAGKTDKQTGSSFEDANAIDLSWQKAATLNFIKRHQASVERDSQVATPAIQNPKDRFYLAEATATGDVVTVSKQLTAKANQLHIELDPPGSDGTDNGQAIRLLKAQDKFSADLPSDTGKLSVSSESMETKFDRRSSGQGQFASAIDLIGAVRATQNSSEQNSQSEIECQKLHIDLIENNTLTSVTENTYSNLNVSGLLADGQVIGRYLAEGESQSSLSADRLIRNEKTQTTELHGQPAELKRGTDWLRSTVISVAERDKNYLLTTPGAGEMRVTFPTADENSPPALLGLNWLGSLEFDGRVNTAVFTGLDNERVTGAIVHSPTRSSQLAADKLELYLQNKEQTSPANKKRPSEDMMSAKTFFKPMGNRTLQKMIMTGRAEVRSIEHPDNKPEERLRAALLKSDVLTYDTYGSEKRQFYGEGPGSLLLEDYRPTDEKVSAAKAASSPGSRARQQTDGLALQRVGPGQTAFVWKDSAKYRQDERTAILAGDVHMVSMGYALTLPGRSPSGTKAQKINRQRTELLCQTFTVTFAELKANKTKEKKSDFADLSAMDELQVEQIEASGDASLISDDVNIEGNKIIYNAKDNEILIEGSSKSQASLTYIDPDKGWGRWTGTKIHYDTAKHKADAPGGRFESLY